MFGRAWLARSWQRWFRPATLGQRGEALAARHLRRRGYRIVARGSRAALGELDLVAVDGRTVVFVEVKTRRSQDAGHPADAVDDDKQRRLTRLAVAYLRRHGLLEYPARFDVVAITWPAGRGKPTVEHFPRAFNAVGHDGMFS
ncbi:MAG: YraN family protein [Planctomycetia bacterium 21-64-5]|nr:MAG: YraN family protein [Planctomycetia bacterium 21-64-5]HQU43881.1 YraN family protein [Pirellulales bacterium]